MIVPVLQLRDALDYAGSSLYVSTGDGDDNINVVFDLSDDDTTNGSSEQLNQAILDGVETAKRLRAEGYDTEYLPIIAVTAATDLDEVRTYRAAGMQAYLEKPVALDDLRATLRAWGHRTRNTPQRKRSAALEALKLRFDDRTLGLLRQIDGALDRSDIDEALVMELRNLLHQLAGTAGSVGQPRLGEVARNQEAALLAAFFAGEDVKPVLENAKSALKAEI